MSITHKGKSIPPEQVLRSMKTKSERGILITPRKGSWKAAWRKIGGKRIYARSRWEANYARYLQFQKDHGIIVDWQHEPQTFWFEKIKRGVRSYTPDFLVTFKDCIEYHEVKGWFDARSKTKIKRMATYHPGVTLRVFASDWFKSANRKIAPLIPGWETSKD